MLKKDYIDWAYRELKKYSPCERLIDDWLVNWKKTLLAIREVHGIFETTVIVFSKCEFLGSLYRGNTAKSNWKDFKDFIDNFFKVRYGELHKIVPNKNFNSEIYSVFRNKIVHGGQPAGIENGKDIIGWWMGYGSYVRKAHLKIDSKGNLNIHCGLLIEDFLDAIKKYSFYLKQDKDTSIRNKKPSVRWREAFWATFCPLYSDKNKWMREWYKLERTK